MTLPDDGDLIKAIGYVSLYSAYLEDDLNLLITKAKSFITFDKKIEQFRLADQAKSLLKELNSVYAKAGNFHDKNNDIIRVKSVLKSVQKIAKERNRILHSPIFAEQLGIDIQHDRKLGTSKRITTAEIYALANNLNILSGNIMHLESCIDKLFLALNN